jgi:hypothetical protein
MSDSSNKFLAFINSRLFVTIVLLIGFPLSLASTSTVWVPLVMSGFKNPLKQISQSKNGKGPLEKFVSGISSQLIHGIQGPLSQMNEGEQDKALKESEVAKQIEVKNVKTLLSSFAGSEKVIGTLVNGSDKSIRAIHLTASFYSADGQLIDVNQEWLSNIKVLPAHQSADFTFTWRYKKEETEEEKTEYVPNSPVSTNNNIQTAQPTKPIKPTRAETSVKIVVSNFEVIKETKNNP